MKKLIATMLVAMLAMPSVMAGENEDLQNEIQVLKQQLQMLEQRLSSQEVRTDRIAASSEMVEAKAMQMEEDSLSMIESWAQLKAVNDRVHISGNVDIVGFLDDNDEVDDGDDDYDDSDDFYVDQVKLNIGLDIHDYVKGHVALRIEEGANKPGGDTYKPGGDAPDDDILLEEAYISIGNPDGGLYLNVGRMYMPFGNYATNFIFDTETQQLGEIRDTGLQVGYTTGAIDVSYFVFNGEAEQADGTGNDDDINTWGLSANYTIEQEDMTLNLGAGYLNNLYQAQESNDWYGNSTEYDHEVDAYNVYATLTTGPLMASYEVVQAMRNNDLGEDPASQHIELGITVPVGEREYLLMAKYEDNDQNSETSIDEVWGLGIATDLYTNTRLTLNYEAQRHSDAVDTETDRNIVAAELSISF